MQKSPEQLQCHGRLDEKQKGCVVFLGQMERSTEALVVAELWHKGLQKPIEYVLPSVTPGFV